MKGTIMYVNQASAQVLRGPDLYTPLETELLLGEGFIVEESTYKGGMRFVVGHTALDCYPGFVAYGDLSETQTPPTHKITAVRAIAHTDPHFKAAATTHLSMNAKAAVTERVDGYALFEKIGWVREDLVRPVDEHATDPIAEALKFVDVLYRWGGSDANLGVDCSALLQQAFRACGKEIPRNTGDQQASDTVGALLVEADELARRQAVFWKGHVGLMVNNLHILHACESRNVVVVEPYAQAVAERGEPILRRRIA